MVRCPSCKELISPSAPSYKCSRGFVDADGVFHDDATVVFHIDCSDFVEPYVMIEKHIKES